MLRLMPLVAPVVEAALLIHHDPYLASAFVRDTVDWLKCASHAPTAPEVSHDGLGIRLFRNPPVCHDVDLVDVTGGGAANNCAASTG